MNRKIWNTFLFEDAVSAVSLLGNTRIRLISSIIKNDLHPAIYKKAFEQIHTILNQDHWKKFVIRQKPNISMILENRLGENLNYDNFLEFLVKQVRYQFPKNLALRNILIFYSIERKFIVFKVHRW